MTSLVNTEIDGETLDSFIDLMCRDTPSWCVPELGYKHLFNFEC